MQLIDLETEVNRLIQNVDNTFWTQTEVDGAINAALLRFCAETSVLRGTNGNPTITGPAQTLALPSDCLEVRQVYFNNRALYVTSQEELMGIIDWQDRTGFPLYYLQGVDGSNAIRFFPYPDATVTGNCLIEYVKRPPTLVNPTDTPTIPTEYHHPIAYYAAFLCLIKSNDQTELNKAQLLKQFWDERLTEAKADSSMNFTRSARRLSFRPF